MLTAIIVAGGSSRRMAFDKTFALLAGRAVIAHSIAAFEEAECVDEIVLVAHPERIEKLRDLARRADFKKIAGVVPGGPQRQDSVHAGLQSLSSAAEFVAVHDAARPLITPADITRVFAAARLHGAASLAAPVNDTLKRGDAEGFVRGSVARDDLYAMQTPQIFRRDLLANAYARIMAEKLTITDEVSALQHLGEKVALVSTDAANLKITFPADLELAECVLRARQPTAP
ncbi:MAG: 2-C-methyl-D-erythritol 4-phosphate cytidylyltransferase [Chthoniobacterales bacterium]